MRSVAYLSLAALAVLAAAPALAQPILSHPAPVKIQPSGKPGGSGLDPNGKIGPADVKTSDVSKMSLEQLTAEKARLEDFLKRQGNLSAQQQAMMKSITDAIAERQKEISKGTLK